MPQRQAGALQSLSRLSQQSFWSKSVRKSHALRLCLPGRIIADMLTGNRSCVLHLRIPSCPTLPRPKSSLLPKLGSAPCNAAVAARQQKLGLACPRLLCMTSRDCASCFSFQLASLRHVDAAGERIPGQHWSCTSSCRGTQRDTRCRAGLISSKLAQAVTAAATHTRQTPYLRSQFAEATGCSSGHT